jgi:hypothetical protein
MERNDRVVRDPQDLRDDDPAEQGRTGDRDQPPPEEARPRRQLRFEVPPEGISDR